VLATSPRATGRRVVYRHGSLTEWYANGPLGLEQGFTLAARPAGPRSGPLTLALRLSGNLHGSVTRAGTAVTFAGSGPAIAYRGLAVTDARGRSLPARLELDGDRLLILVADARARYPLTVDPLVQQAELTASDSAAGDQFGASVSVSGSTIVVGAEAKTVGSNADQGAAYVFTLSGGSWSQTAKLTASDGAANDQFGQRVAVSGSTIVVAAPEHKVGSNVDEGMAYVFVKPAGGWVNATETAQLTASDGAAHDLFGIVAGVSGSTIVVGDPNHTVGGHVLQGAAYVFVEPASGWVNATETQKLIASDGAASDGFGSVAISGSTIVVGAGGHKVGSNAHQGAVYVFTLSGGSWSQTAELTASDGAANDEFGAAVAVSGSTIVADAPIRKVGSNIEQGVAYVFALSGGSWAQTAELTASDGTAQDGFGWGVEVSGSTLVVGALSQGNGTAYVFTLSGGSWSQTAELTSSDGTTSEEFGGSVSVSGSTIVVGADLHANITGAAYVFIPVPGVTAVSTSKLTGAYKSGASIPITVTFSDPVTVTGTPLLALNSSATAEASFTSASGNTLTFTYTVGAGENASALDYGSTGALTLNGGTIQDALGNNAKLTLPAPASASDSLYSTDITIDTVKPTIQVPSPAVTVNATSPTGATVDFHALVTMSDNTGGSGLASTGNGCTPAPGSLFGIGLTTVNCTALDLAGNEAMASFTVKVLSPAQQATVMLGQVTPIGQSGLIKTVQQIQADIAKNHTSAACSDLTDLAGLIKAQTKKALTTVQATTLTGEVTDLKHALGC
jgi:nucleoside-specific outer membrane channel protein Tsx